MPIPVVCSECDAEYQVSNNLAGQRIRCRECEAPLRVPGSGRAEVQAEPPRRPAAKVRPAPRDVEDEDDDRPRRRRRDEDDEDDDRPRRRRRRDEPERSPVPLALLIGGGVLLFLVVAGIGAGWFLFRRAALAPGPVARPGMPQTNPVAPPPVPPGDNNPPPQPAAPLPPPLVWNVVADAPPAPFVFPDVEGTLPLGRSGAKITFPSTLSPFVGVGGIARNTVTIHDLRTLKSVGTVEVGNFSKLALSPDGTHLAAHSYSAKEKGVRVWTVADGKLIDTFDEKTTFVLALDFASGGRVVVATNGSAGKTLVRVWDPAARREASRFEVDLFSDWGKTAFSPGRRYLAIPPRNKDPLRVFDLDTGRVAGELPVPAQRSTPDTQGMAFSADGSLLATLYRTFDGGDRLLVWEVAGGKLRHDHPVGQDNVDLHGLSFGGERRGLEWLPDGTSLVLAGRAFVETASGRVYWKLPGDNDRHPSRVLSASRVALVKDVRREGSSLQVTPLPTEQMALVRKAGGTQGEAASGLPPAKSTDWSAVKEQPAPSGVAAWKATVEAAPAAPKPTDRDIPIRVKGPEIDRVLLAAAGGRAAVLSTASGSLGTRRQVRVDWYDLAGKNLGTGDLFAFEPTSRGGGQLTAGLSLDGAALLVLEPRQGKRIDVWSAEGKHVTGWVPYDKEQQPRVRWARLLDAGRALTLSEGGRLALWKLPECRAEWSIKGVLGGVGLSPGGKYLAVSPGSTYELLATDSGERVGSLAGRAGRFAESFAFRPDGKALAALVRDGLHMTLLRWDLARGEGSGELPLPPQSGNELAWVGDGAVLVGTSLVDLKLRLPVVSYHLSGEGRGAGIAPDGRYWYASTPGGKEAVLTSRTLPDAAAAQAARTLAATPLAIAPGMKVAVQVNGGNPADPNMAQRVRDMLNNRLQGQGFVVAPGGLTLTVQIGGEQPTGVTHRYRILGGRSGSAGSEVSIAVKRVECSSTLADGRGTLWNATHRVETPKTGGLVRVDTLEKSLSETVWRQVESWANNPTFPTLAVRGPRGLQTLPLPVFLDAR